MYTGLFPNKIEVPDGASYDVKYPDQQFSSSAVLPKYVKIWGTEYKPGDVLIIKVESFGVLNVGLLKSIVVDMKTVSFLCDIFKAELGKSNSYSTTVKVDSDIFVKYDILADYRPLLRRGSLESFSFLLHHYVSEHI